MKGETKGWIKVGGARPSHFLRFKITTILLLLYRSPQGTRPLLYSLNRYKSECVPPLSASAWPFGTPSSDGGGRDLVNSSATTIISNVDAAQLIKHFSHVVGKLKPQLELPERPE